MAGEQIPESWVGQRVTIWARAEGHPFEDARGRLAAGYDQAIGEFSGQLKGVNDLGTTLAIEDESLAFFPWCSVARIVLATR